MDVMKLVRLLAASLLFALAPLAASAQGLLRDAEIEAILREYSDPIFAASGLQPADVDIYLINDPTMNAFVAGGQRVHIHTGLIIAADTPEQLKGVIAHETCHIACGHAITRREAMGAAGNMSLISMGLGVLAIAVGAPDAGMALIGSSQTFAALTFFKHTRTEEAAADISGVNYLAASGQSGRGLIEFFDKFRYQELMSDSRRDPYFRVHPISSDRVSKLRQRVAELDATDAVKPQTERAIHQLDMMKAKLIGYLGPASRVAQRYPESNKSQAARYARAHAAYRAVDIKRAMTETESLIAEEPDNPYFQELAGMIMFESGRFEDSIPYYRRSVELSPNQPLLMTNLARSLTEKGDADSLKEAEDLLVVAISREANNAFAWNQLSRVYAKQGRNGDADLAVAEEAYAIGDMTRAHIFSRRAVGKLSPDTPNGRRASDISALSDPRARRSRG